MVEVDAGMKVEVTGGSGIRLRKRAVSAPVEANGFKVVWACSEMSGRPRRPRGASPMLSRGPPQMFGRSRSPRVEPYVS